MASLVKVRLCQFSWTQNGPYVFHRKPDSPLKDETRTHQLLSLVRALLHSGHIYAMCCKRCRSITHSRRQVATVGVLLACKRPSPRFPSAASSRNLTITRSPSQQPLGQVIRLSPGGGRGFWGQVDRLTWRHNNEGSAHLNGFQSVGMTTRRTHPASMPLAARSLPCMSSSVFAASSAEL